MNRTSLNRVYRVAAFAAMGFAVGTVFFGPLAVPAVAFAAVALRAYRRANPGAPVFTTVKLEGNADTPMFDHLRGVDRFGRSLYGPEINPASGLMMTGGGVDTAGNPYGSNRNRF